jgi:hypothetical protein
MTTEGGVRLEDGQVGRSALAAWGRHMGVPEPDPDVVRRRLTAGSLPEVFASTARRYPDAPALDIAGSSVTHGPHYTSTPSGHGLPRGPAPS